MSSLNSLLGSAFEAEDWMSSEEKPRKTNKSKWNEKKKKCVAGANGQWAVLNDTQINGGQRLGLGQWRLGGIEPILSVVKGTTQAWDKPKV